jgi:hypothetical protein
MEVEGRTLDSVGLKEEVCKIVDALTELLMGLSTEIHRTPELSFEEHKAVQLITAALRDGGFEIEKGIAGLETAFRATHPSRSNGPRIAFLAEYDALPDVGHACGHNIIAGSAVGAALAVGKIKERLPGTLQILGCPAEEKGVAKGPAQNDSIFNETIERKWTEQWLFFANSIRLASAMAGADYGVFANGRWYLSSNVHGMLDCLQFKLKKE